MDCLGYLRAMCMSNEKCSTCLLYDSEEEETACLLCKAEGNSLADNIVEAYSRIGMERSKKKNETAAVKDSPSGAGSADQDTGSDT